MKDARRLARQSGGVSKEPGRLSLGHLPGLAPKAPDRFGRSPLAVVDVWTIRRDGRRALTVRVVIGLQAPDPQPQVLA